MLSVVVPVYNAENYLEKCVESIMGQTYTDIEIILVNDGSSDRSGAVCDVLACRDVRIHVIHKENGGNTCARKEGIRHCRGEYITFVDADDWIEPQMYEKLVQTAAEYKADMVLSGRIEDSDGNMVCRANGLKLGVYDREEMEQDLYPHMLCMEDFFSMGVQPYLWNKLMRRELAYQHVMAVDDRIRIGEDVAAVMPMILAAGRTVITDYCGYHYCMRGTSMMMRHEDGEKEWKRLCILHKFLMGAFQKFDGKYRLEYQLSHYTVGNMLTRVYGKLAYKAGENILWPFGYRVDSRKCILYSAGNFGRAVYGYMHDIYPDLVHLWVDKEYRLYQSMGLPVHSVDDISLETEADILIAVLNVRLAALIRSDLLQIGVHDQNIYCINITDEDVAELLGNM
ncbi:MAG: glycosyltransferase family 2 protein [Ruminococcus flavefaciens]|nr:glycosyltransferase family 2 protein [Ruminococcus flavefaciens]